MTTEYVVQECGLGPSIWRDHSYFATWKEAEIAASKLANQMVKGYDRIRVIKRTEEQMHNSPLA